MARVVVHVGMAKCGSTFLHDNFKSNRNEGFGFGIYNVLVPVIDKAMIAASGGAFAAHKNVQLETFDAEYAKFKESIASEINNLLNFKSIVFSNECLTGIYPDVFRHVDNDVFNARVMRDFQRHSCQQLKDIFPDAIILMVVREPLSWLRSVYNNLVTMGMSLTGDQFLRQKFEVVRQWYNIDYLYDLYSEFFGAENIVLMPLELNRIDENLFRSTIEEVVGQSMAWSVASANKSMPTGALVELRKINRIIEEFSPPELNWNDHGLQLKMAMWKFIFSRISNSTENIDKIKSMYGVDELFFDIPDSYKKKMCDSCTVVEQVFDVFGIH